MFATGTINDLKQDIIDALQGRTDITDEQIARYTARSLREITESYPFPELETTGPTVALTTGVSEYPISTFLNTGDGYTFAVSFTVYVDSPANTVTAPVRYKTPTAIEPITAPSVLGIPAWFTRFGSTFRFAPVPAAAYAVFLRYQGRHPFSPTPKLDDAIYIPRSWNDIVAYSTAMRIAVTKRWTDQRQELHDMLYGDPEFVNSQGKRGRPGLIAARVFQQERDEMFNSRSITPVVARVNPR